MTEPRPGPDESDSAREMIDALADIARRSQLLLAEYAAMLEDEDGFQVVDFRTMAAVFQEWAAKAAANPASVLAEQLAYWTNMHFDPQQNSRPMQKATTSGPFRT